MGLGEKKYIVPALVVMKCTEQKTTGKDNTCKNKCIECPLLEGTKEIYLNNSDAEHASIMANLIGKNKKSIEDCFRKLFQVPSRSKCKEIEIDEKVMQSVQTLILETDMEDMDEGAKAAQVKCMLLNDKSIDITSRYMFSGTVGFDDDTREALSISWHADKTADSLDTWKAEDNLDLLTRFIPENPGSTESIIKKIGGYCEYIGERVTRIRGRQDIIIATDLVYHSVIKFTFNGKELEKGWLEAGVIGDTSTGKSETIRNLNRFYKAGEFISSGETASRSGLLGGVKTVGGQQIIEWGKIPKNNGKLVVIDEADTLRQSSKDSKSIMSELTDLRRSGVATVTKTVSGKVPARTRIIWISNNPDGGDINPSAESIGVVEKVFGDKQDVARVDLAMVCLKSDVSPEDRHMDFKGEEEAHPLDEVYTSEACHARVMFAWTRKKENISFEPEALLAIKEYAEKLEEDYSLQIPLVADIKTKLARAAVSMACMLFSVDADNIENVIVSKAHVDVVKMWVVNQYRKMQYDIYSMRTKEKPEWTEIDRRKVDRFFSKEHVIVSFINLDRITDETLSDALNVPINDDVLHSCKSILKETHCIKEWKNRQKVKSEKFTKYLKEQLNAIRKDEGGFVSDRDKKSY